MSHLYALAKVCKPLGCLRITGNRNLTAVITVKKTQQTKVWSNVRVSGNI